ncbi:1948_t:CDS:1, partial [Racocetra fulgida]
APIINNITLIPNPPVSNSTLEAKGSATTNADMVDGALLVFQIANNNGSVFYTQEYDICGKLTTKFQLK